MKKTLIILLIVLVLIIAGCDSGKTLEELTGHSEYGDRGDNPWTPFGKSSVIGKLENGEPVRVYEGDINRYYIYIGEMGSGKSKIGTQCRTDVVYPEMVAESIDEIEYVSYVDGTADFNKNVIRDREYVQKVFNILSKEDEAVMLEVSPDESETFAKRLGVIAFYNDDFPGLNAVKGIVSYKGDNYYVIDNSNGNKWLCIKDEGTITFE